jgi:hypothetical protein
MTDPAIHIGQNLDPLSGQAYEVDESAQLFEQDTIDKTGAGYLGRVGNWIKSHKLKLLVGVAATSAAVTLINDPFAETKENVMEAAPWVAAGVVASEALFIAGAGMMLASVGEEIGNPLTMKKRTKDIARKANNSVLFKTGFVTNTVGAVGDFVVLSTGVMKELPPSAWGVLTLTLADLSLTVAVRKGILNSIREQSEDNIAAIVE